MYVMNQKAQIVIGGTCAAEIFIASQLSLGLAIAAMQNIYESSIVSVYEIRK
jgi:hypothetical protein